MQKKLKRVRMRIGIVGVKKFREGDIIDVYEIEKKKRKLILN